MAGRYNVALFAELVSPFTPKAVLVEKQKVSSTT